MTVISDDKKPNGQVYGMLTDDNSVDNNSNEIIANNQLIELNEEIINERSSDDYNFPVDVKRSFIDAVNKPRWVVPVLPGGDLEKMMLFTIKCAYKNKDKEMDEFKDLYKLGFLTSFEKIFNDDAVLGWKIDILDSIYRNSVIMMKLCALKIMDDNECILDILSIVFNLDSKYHQCPSNNFSPPNINRVGSLDEFMEIIRTNDDNDGLEITNAVELPPVTDYKYALTTDNRRTRIIYVDLINMFGHFNGFSMIKARVEQFESLVVPDLSANLTIILGLLRPIALSIDHLSSYTLLEYVAPITEKAVTLILNMNKDVIKQEAIKEWKSDKFSSIIHHLEIILRKINDDHDYLNQLSLFRLNIILKILQHASFNGRMNALNELNKLIKSMYSSIYQPNTDDQLKHIVHWITDNDVLSITLKENLHQPQYVEKVEKLIRFMIKENSLTNDDLDRLWYSQIDKHDAIVTNIHDLLAKLAYDFNADQLHHLFDCFQKSWSNASKKQRERLIDLIRRLAEEDKEGRMAKSALKLLWDLATQNDSPLDILESALRAHTKILDFSCIQDRDNHRNEWLVNLLKYLKDVNNQRNAVSALRQIKEILKLFQPVFNVSKCADRIVVIQQLETDHAILDLVTNNLVNYVDNGRIPGSGPYVDEKFPHDINIDERLDTLKFFLTDGSLTLNTKLLVKIWTCLVVPSASNDTFSRADRDQCFSWLVSVTENGWSLFDVNVLEDFFTQQFLTLDPKLLTLNGISLFEQLFGMINLKKGYIRGGYSQSYVTNQMDLIGLDYLWRCAVFCFDPVVFSKILNMLKIIKTNLGPSLLSERKTINEEFIQHCTLILESAFKTATSLFTNCQSISSVDVYVFEHYEVSPKMEESINKIHNIIQVLCEFVRECDNRFQHERTFPSLCRMCYGQRKILSVISNSLIGQNSPTNLIVVDTHSNELFGNLRKMIEAKLKNVSNDDYHLEISIGNETVVEMKDNYKTLEQLDIINGIYLHTRWISAFKPKFNCKTTNEDNDEVEEENPEDVEDYLPGVMISSNKDFIRLIVNIGDLSLIINNEKLRWSIHHLLDLLPPERYLVDKIKTMTQTDKKELLYEILYERSPMNILYTLNVLYSLMLPCNNLSAADESIILLKHLLVSDSLELFWEIVRFDQNIFLSVFVPRACEMNSIRLIGLIRLLNIIYVLLTVLGGVIHAKTKGALKFEKLNTMLKEDFNLCSLPYNIIDGKLQEIVNDEEFLMKVSSKCLPHRQDIDALVKLSWCCAIGNKLDLMAINVKEFQEKSMEIIGSEPNRLTVSVSSDQSMSNITKWNAAPSQETHHTVTANNVLSKTDHDIQELINQPTCGALECLTLALSCSNDTNILDLIKEKYTKDFIIVMLLYTRSGHIRRKSADEIRLILSFSDDCKATEHVIQMLFTKLHNVTENPIQYGNVFNLVVKLLCDTHKMGSQLSNTEALFKCQLDQLLEMKRLPDNASNQARQIHGVLLIGRLRIVNELVRFFTPQVKTAQNKTHDLINILLHSFLFPSSKRYSDISNFHREQQRDFQSSYMDNNRELPHWATAPLMNPICNTLESQTAAFEVLKSLVAGSSSNMEMLCSRIIALFYNDHRNIHNEWDYKPSFVSRSLTGFVGLKNAGATCYMNSILQQLFMIAPIRRALLSVDAGPPAIRDDFDDNILYNTRKESVKRSTDPNALKLDILREVQMIFGNLAFSQNQYFTPTGFWRHFKLWGDEINLREQHDAVEFFNCLVDTVDEGLSTIKMPKIFEEVLGGTFADQKICKGCPHHYESEDKFTTLSVDVHHHQNLLESLEFYVKGDLLEGDNAYYCGNCKEKRDTVKRVCIKKLPLVLAIQLKRFDYDWERDISVKFNDYFEFPNELDMAPYTVAGISKKDHLNSIKDCGRSPSLSSTESEITDANDICQTPENSTRYILKGVVVHGGQASGGHYYSYIREKQKLDGASPFDCSDSDETGYCWYRFDDTEVTECKMDAEEMKNQWFGGDFMGESYDHMVKRVSLRRQKRWWSAYILFYEREDYANHSILNELQEAVRIISKGNDTPSPMDGNNMFNISRLPRHIEENITLQNIQYMHTKNQYTSEYFSFLRDLPRIITLNEQLLPVKVDKSEMTIIDVELMRTVVSQLLSRFLFSTGFRTNRTIRGQAIEWFESLKLILEPSEKARMEFCTHAFFNPMTKITEYVLESPNAEIREVCANLIKYISHWSMRDSMPGYCYSKFLDDINLKDLYGFVKERFCTDLEVKLSHILMGIMHVLLSKDTNEYGSSCTEFMSFFYDYPRFGYPELNHCLDVNLPTYILKYCLDEYFPNSSPQRVDINKLICSFCQMMRCYDLDNTCIDMQIDMIIPQREALKTTYPTEVPDIPINSKDNSYYFVMDSKPIWRIRNIPDHLYKYLFVRTNKFMKRVIDDFYNEYTKDDLIIFLKYLCFDNWSFSEIVIGTLSYELEHAFIKNAKLFLDLFRSMLDVEDSLKIRRVLCMIEGEQLDVAGKFKHNSDRRCYYIMKMILFSINQLNEIEKKQLWEDLSNPQQTYDKLTLMLDNLKKTIHTPSVGHELRSNNVVIESNEESSANNIERTNSTDELETIGIDILKLFTMEKVAGDSEGTASTDTDQSITDLETITLNIDTDPVSTNPSIVVVPSLVDARPSVCSSSTNDTNTDNNDSSCVINHSSLPSSTTPSAPSA